MFRIIRGPVTNLLREDGHKNRVKKELNWTVICSNCERSLIINDKQAEGLQFIRCQCRVICKQKFPESQLNREYALASV